MVNNCQETGNQQFDYCKVHDQHEFSACCAGLITKCNIDSEWAKNIVSERLWDDVTKVAESMEQRKFKEFYQNLVSYKYLDHKLIERVEALIKLNKDNKIENSVLEKSLQDTHERMGYVLRVFD